MPLLALIVAAIAPLACATPREPLERTQPSKPSVERVEPSASDRQEQTALAGLLDEGSKQDDVDRSAVVLPTNGSVSGEATSEVFQFISSSDGTVSSTASRVSGNGSARGALLLPDGNYRCRIDAQVNYDEGGHASEFRVDLGGDVAVDVTAVEHESDYELTIEDNEGNPTPVQVTAGTDATWEVYCQ